MPFVEHRKRNLLWCSARRWPDGRMIDVIHVRSFADGAAG